MDSNLGGCPYHIVDKYDISYVFIHTPTTMTNMVGLVDIVVGIVCFKIWQFIQFKKKKSYSDKLAVYE